tara:strand:+ start:242 stop:406 length:165 start_codon:yes stop_codon:yes gene_type:complete
LVFDVDIILGSHDFLFGDLVFFLSHAFEILEAFFVLAHSVEEFISFDSKDCAFL